MPSKIHLDPQDLIKAGEAFGLEIAQSDGGFTIKWSQSNVSVGLQQLQLKGSFTFERMRVEAEIFSITQAGVEATFRVL